MSDETQIKYGFLVDSCCVRNIKCRETLDKVCPTLDTLEKVFKKSLEQFPNNKCLGYRKIISTETKYDKSSKKEIEKITFGTYNWITYSEAYERMKNFAKGLFESGLTITSKVAIFLNTCVEWQIAAHACYFSNLTLVTFYATLGEDAVIHGLNESEATHIITGELLLNIIKNALPHCQYLKNIIFVGQSNKNYEETEIKFHPFVNIEKIGEKSKLELTPPQANDLAMIMYTSGTTGIPKGVMISHKNVVSSFSGVKNSIGTSWNLFVPDDVYIAYLPLAHILELVCEETILSVGGALGFSSPYTLFNTSPKIKLGSKGDCSELQPTLMTTVPAILERIKKSINEKIASSTAIIRYLFNRALATKKAALLAKKKTPIWDLIFFNKIKSVLGNKIKIVLSGGAPLLEETQIFLKVVFGIPFVQGYGLTETCGTVAITNPGDQTYGRVGAPITSLEMKLRPWPDSKFSISEEVKELKTGEILVHGENICSGYYRDEQKTNEDFIVEDDKLWFCTGDIGVIHPDGCIQIVDRKKDLVKLQMGEYVSLGKVESVLKSSLLIENVCVFANPLEKYVVAIIVPIKKKIYELANVSESNSNFEELCNDKEIVAQFLTSVSEVSQNGKLQRFEVPKKIYITSIDWLPETGFITTALKIKRHAVYKHYEKEIMNMYSPKESSNFN